MIREDWRLALLRRWRAEQILSSQRMNPESQQPRLLLIGLDSIPLPLLDECCAQGLLPNLSRFRREGRTGLVTSDATTFPGSVWQTFFTMSDVSYHADYHLLYWDANRKRLRAPGRDKRQITPFWHRLARDGVPVIAFDVPYSDTGRAPTGSIEVYDWAVHGATWSASYPNGLLRGLTRRHGASERRREPPEECPDDAIVGELPGLVRDVARRSAIIEDLAQSFEWRLLVTVYSETHRAGHWFWGERGTGVPQGGVRRVLQAFDERLPQLRALLRPQDQIAVFSAHGMGPGFDMDRLVEAAVGYLTKAHGGAARRLPDPVKVLRDNLPPGLVRLITRTLPQGLYNWAYPHLQNTRCDWRRQPWIINPLDSIVYVHANQRPWDGDAAEFSEGLDALASEFRGIKTFSGEDAVEAVIRPAEVYGGPRLALLPDLVVLPARRPLGPELILADGSRRRVRRHSSRDGEHLPEGFYIQVGRGISAGSRGRTVPGEELASLLCEPAGLHAQPMI